MMLSLIHSLLDGMAHANNPAVASPLCLTDTHLDMLNSVAGDTEHAVTASSDGRILFHYAWRKYATCWFQLWWLLPKDKETRKAHHQRLCDILAELEWTPQPDKSDMEENVYCICRRGDNGRPMVGCDTCEEW